MYISDNKTEMQNCEYYSSPSSSLLKLHSFSIVSTCAVISSKVNIDTLVYIFPIFLITEHAVLRVILNLEMNTYNDLKRTSNIERDICYETFEQVINTKYLNDISVLINGKIYNAV